jgi:hypothetical protein
MRCQYRGPLGSYGRRTQLGTDTAPRLAAVARLAVLELDLAAHRALIVVVVDVSVALANRVPRWYASHRGTNIPLALPKNCDLSHCEAPDGAPRGLR